MLCWMAIVQRKQTNSQCVVGIAMIFDRMCLSIFGDDQHILKELGLWCGDGPLRVIFCEELIGDNSGSQGDLILHED